MKIKLRIAEAAESKTQLFVNINDLTAEELSVIYWKEIRYGIFAQSFSNAVLA